MNYNIGKMWRDSASLIMLSKRRPRMASLTKEEVNYDILLQTRTGSASFANSVVFPGGVSEQVDGADAWLPIIKSFGFNDQDFRALHHPAATLAPIFQDNPVRRHISLRITAIRETFEELGLLLCSSDNKRNRKGKWASILTDIDVKHWQDRISNDPGELLNLCKEYNCYPDIWSLHYWSNWLSPVRLPKRFSTAFFVTALENKNPGLKSNSEVTKVEWSSPLEIIEKPDVVLYPPQVYELKRLSYVTDLDELLAFAKKRSSHGGPLLYPVFLKAKDGMLHVLPGDELYPSSIDYNDTTIQSLDGTIEELRESSKSVHRYEHPKGKTPSFVFKNFKPENHINMGDLSIPVNVTIP